MRRAQRHPSAKVLNNYQKSMIKLQLIENTLHTAYFTETLSFYSVLNESVLL